MCPKIFFKEPILIDQVKSKSRAVFINIPAVLLFVVLSACASSPNVGVLPEGNKIEGLGNAQDSVAELNQDQVKSVTAAELAEDVSLPTQELTATTLEQLLTVNFASLNSQWSLAAQNALDSAKGTQDFRLARLATLFSLQTLDYEAASEASALWLALKPDSIDAQNLNIAALVGASKVDAAKQAVDRQKVGQNIDDYIKQVAALLIRQKNGDAGFDVIDYLVETHPESAQVHVSAAYVAEVFERYEAAEFWVNKALELRPGWDLAAQMNMRLLQTQNKFEARSAFIAEFVEQYPASIAMRISHSSELAAAEEYQSAYNIILEVLKDAPEDIGALQFAAALAQQLDDSNQAAYFYRRALNIEPNNDDVRWSAARLALAQSKYVTAERLFGEISAEDKIFEAQIQLANVRYENAGVDASMRTLSAIEPKTNAEYLRLAITRHYLLMRAFKYEEAFGYTNDTLVYIPNNLDLLYARGLVAAELKKLTVAERDLRAVIAADPENANALNALGYTLADQTDRLEEAKVLIAKALELRPDDAHILDSWGWLAFRMKEYVKAIEFLKRAYEISPDVEVAAHLGEALWASGDQQGALDVWQEAYVKSTNNPVLNATLKRYDVTFSGIKSLAVQGL